MRRRREMAFWAKDVNREDNFGSSIDYRFGGKVERE